MTSKLVAAAAALFLAGALPPAATGSAAERAGATSASAAKDGGQAMRTARRCRTDRERRARRRATCARRVGVIRPKAGGLASWGSLDRLDAGGAPPPTGGPVPPDQGAGGTSPPVTDPVQLPRSLSVSAREFFLSLSRPLVGTGTVTIELRNNGEDPHNLVVSPDDGSHAPLLSYPDLEPGAYLRKSVTLAPGRYALWCSLEFHEALGMSATLRVE